MRARAVTLVSVAALALSPAAILAANAPAKTAAHHAGQKCSPKKKPPKGFKCKKDSKGKYVLVKKSATKKKK